MFRVVYRLLRGNLRHNEACFLGILTTYFEKVCHLCHYCQRVCVVCYLCIIVSFMYCVQLCVQWWWYRIKNVFSRNTSSCSSVFVMLQVSLSTTESYVPNDSKRTDSFPNDMRHVIFSVFVFNPDTTYHLLLSLFSMFQHLSQCPTCCICQDRFTFIAL